MPNFLWLTINISCNENCFCQTLFAAKKDSISKVIHRLFMWCDGCSCHWRVLAEACDRADNAAEVPSAFLASWRSCSLRGRRLPELAAGDFFLELNELFAQNGAALMTKLSPQLNDEQRLCILNDYERGRSSFTTILIVKLAHWTAPPWCAFALAHADQAKASEAYVQLRRAAAGSTLHGRRGFNQFESGGWVRAGAGAAVVF